ncbi:hypothetical protein GGS23DRAFT_595314 [Durotheca rogersii]|uniref:uncharacterized protein n=1 Tax=Durotheca rogersii TaxID=419775 RepID=UPI0022207FA7|nr:uncharacterized protein GGS23DRAFT_595314 [Durotheca rogersii]KAI5864594.1 hypothetical protein GGS23DRAFT_595314 [Durotheca rogersii]
MVRLVSAPPLSSLGTIAIGIIVIVVIGMVITATVHARFSYDTVVSATTSL